MTPPNFMRPEYTALYIKRGDGDYDLMVIVTKTADELFERLDNNNISENLTDHLFQMLDLNGEEVLKQESIMNDFPDVLELISAEKR